jgi:hypothetical protein
VKVKYRQVGLFLGSVGGVGVAVRKGTACQCEHCSEGRRDIQHADRCSKGSQDTIVALELIATSVKANGVVSATDVSKSGSIIWTKPSKMTAVALRRSNREYRDDAAEPEL